jgi:hypothetical protein
MENRIIRNKIGDDDLSEATMHFDVDGVQRALRKAWSLSTSSLWTADNPAGGETINRSMILTVAPGNDPAGQPERTGEDPADDGHA